MATVGLLPTEFKEINYGGNEHTEIVITNPMNLVENGVSDYKIVTGSSATAVESKAASELQTYLKQISGATLEIVTDVAAPTDKEICVGKTNREELANLAVDRLAIGDDGFRKVVKGNKLFIVGGNENGTLYGVYSFLEEELGCRWFTQELKVIPENKTVVIEKTTDNTQKAHFEFRDDFWQCVFTNPQFKAFHKLNSASGSVIPSELGGSISYADFAHSMERLVPNSLFETNPEYFSYRIEQDARTLEQRCLTNPDVLRITIENARNTLNNNPNAKIMSITQNDNQDYCQCEVCSAMDEKYGGPSGTNIWFVNEVAQALEDEFPHITFDTFAYQYTRKPPVGIKPRANVCVRLCSIECCFAHPLSECGHERGESLYEQTEKKESTFAKDIEGWAEICDRLYIWDYTTNFNHYLEIFPNFHVLADNMQFFHENNVRGVMEQGNYNGGNSGEFGELRAYIIAKLLWNPYADVEYHMMDFMNAYYGEESSKYIKEYIDYVTNITTQRSHLFIFNWHNQNAYLNSKDINKCDEFWKKAIENAKDEQKLDNINRSHLSYRFYKAAMLKGEFSILNPVKYYQSNKEFYHDIADHGIIRIREHKNYEIPEFYWIRIIEALDSDN